MESTQREFLHPLWVRIWHWVNALLFVVLAVSGFSLHLSGSGGQVLPFRTAIVLHNASGALFTVALLLFLLFLAFSGEWRQYLSWRPGMVSLIGRNLRFYLVGAFKGEPHPEAPTRNQKFNALQQVTYLAVMIFGVVPIAITGVMLNVPETAPKQVLGAGGIWPVAVAHSLLAYGLVAFLIAHVYLTTMGATPWSDIRGMFTGWHERAHGSSAATPTQVQGDTQ